MKKIYHKFLLIVGLMVCSLFVMSSELVKEERHTLGVQIEQPTDNVSIDLLNVDMTALKCMPEKVPINEAEVEISYGIFNAQTINFNQTQGLKINNNQKVQLLESLQNYDIKVKSNIVAQKTKTLTDNLFDSGEVRIRGKPSTTQTI